MSTSSPHVGDAPSGVANNRAYRPDIDGLRAIAILAVVLHHAGLRMVPGGFTGVDIFFVISGYLIGGHIYAEASAGHFRFADFYGRRARRILPAFFVVLLFTVVAALLLLSPEEAAVFGRDAFGAVLSASNLVFWRFSNYFDARSSLHPLLMTWSLGVEEQFYAVAPLLILLLVKLRRNLLFVALSSACAISFLLAQYELGSYPTSAFYLLSSRAWELGAGVLLAVFEMARRPLALSRVWCQIAGVAGFALICGPIVLLNNSVPFPGLAALPSVAGTALLMAAPGCWVSRRLLSLRPMAFIGKISYSWYLWHWPLLAFMRVACGGRLHLPAALSAVTLAFVVAVFSWRFIEQPFRRPTRKLGPLKAGTLLLRYTACSATMLAVCAAIWFTNGLPWRFPQVAAMESAGEPLRNDPCLLGRGNVLNISAACVETDSGQGLAVVWGDSHAAALAPALRAMAGARGQRFVELTKNSCTPLLGATHYIPRIPYLAADCQRFNQQAFAKIAGAAGIHTVVLTASWSAPLNRTWLDGWLIDDAGHAKSVPTAENNQELYLSALAATLNALQNAGKTVIVIEDTPGFGFDPIERVRTAHIPLRAALANILIKHSRADGKRNPNAEGDTGFAAPEENPNALLAHVLLRQAASRAPLVMLFDSTPSLCEQPDECMYRDGNTMLYSDSTHVTAEGARRALEHLRWPTR